MTDTNIIEPVLRCDCEGNCQDEDSATCPCMNTPCPDDGCDVYSCVDSCECNIKGECGVDVDWRWENQS